MADPRDIVDIASIRRREEVARQNRLDADAAARTPRGRPWLSIWFRCCHTYGRIYRNDAGTMYLGRCPKCGKQVRALVGPGGTNRRMFEAK